MGPKIHIVTDSTAYLSAEYLEDNPHVHVVPLSVNCGGDIVEDFVENNDKFIESFNKMDPKDFPATSQPAPGRFAEVFQPLVDQGHEIVAIIISSKLSGAIQSAMSAASMVGEEKISVVDSLTTIASLRMLVEDAAAAALENKDRKSIVAMLEEKKPRMEVLMLPGSLEHLRRGGRIGGAQALVGSLLNIKPILYITDEGYIDVLEKVRTLKKALNRIVEEIPEGCRRVSFGQVAGEENAAILRELAQAKTGMTVPVQEVGPVIATHAGAGMLGLFFEIPEK